MSTPRITRLIPLLGLMPLIAAPVTASAVPVVGGFYVGAGATTTSFDAEDTDSRFGYRIYGGLDFANITPALRLGLEGGFIQSGSFETEAGGSDRLNNRDLGLHGTLTVIPALDLHARTGYEWGDSSGTIFALGLSAPVLPLLRIRAEYQNRDEFDGYFLGLEVRTP